MNESAGSASAEAKQIFLEALELPLEQRGAFLERRCAADAPVRAQVHSLLRAHEQAGEFLSQPTVQDGQIDLPGAQAGTHAPQAEVAPRQIGPYKILQELGEGGFGTVYLAEQQHPVRRRVALKLIKPGMDSRQVIARFEAERQALAMMDHPNIAKVLDAGATDGGRPYFVMELVKGIPITDYCDREKLSIRQRLELFAQVCHAVQHAHQKGLIHRDIKPSNILVDIQDDAPHARVIDFGIAKATQARLTEKTLFTEFRQLIGTPEYMSPEQAEGSLDIDTRTDVYALGVLLYELLTGTTPFDAHELRSRAYAEIQRMIREVDPPRPSTRLSAMKETLARVAAHRRIEPGKLNTLVRGELDWIVMKAMEKDRARRYETANGLAADVVRYLTDEPVSARPPTAGYLLRKFARRNRGPVIASAAVLVVLIGGIVGTTIGLLGQSRQRVIAEQQRTEAERQRTVAQSQEQEARRQAAIAEAVSDFQSDMLATADPDRLLGDKVTVLQAVTAAVQELDAGKLKDQPLVEASVRQIIGSTLRTLARYDEAETNLRKALELRRASLPAEHLDTADTLVNLGLLLHAQGKLEEAGAAFREVLEIRRKVLPPGHEDIAEGLNNLARLLYEQEQYAQAEPLFREALEMVRKALPAGHKHIATALNNLAQVLMRQNRLSEAESLFRESLDIRRRGMPEGHPDIAQGLNNLAGLLDKQGRFAESEPLYRESLDIFRQALPAGHPTLATALSNLAWLLRARGKLDEAESLYQEALEIQRKALPVGHMLIASTLANFSGLLLARGKLPEAEAACREALEIHRKVLPADHPRIAAGLDRLAQIYHAQGKLDQAEPTFRESLALFEGKFGTDSPQAASTRVGLGLTLIGLNRYAEAENNLIEAEKVLAASQSTPRAPHEHCMEALIALYTAWNRIEPDKGYGERADEWKRRPSTKPADHSGGAT